MTMRDRVQSLEASMVTMTPYECPIRHIFAPGVYAREMTAIKDVVLVGAVHKTAHLSVLSKGRVCVVSGESVVELAAPATLVSGAGEKRAIFVLEDAVWTNIHATTETDLDKLVAELTESTMAQLQGGADNVQQTNYAALIKE